MTLTKKEMAEIEKGCLKNYWLVGYCTYKIFTQIVCADSKKKAIEKSINWWLTHDPEKFMKGDESLLSARKATREDLDKHSGCMIIYK